MLKQIMVISIASSILPVLFLVGSIIPISGLRNWPSWLIYVWPSQIMLMPFGGQSSPPMLVFIPFAIASIIVNAGFWCLVLISAWYGLRRLGLNLIRSDSSDKST